MIIDTILSELEKDPVRRVESFSSSGLLQLSIEPNVPLDALFLWLHLSLRLRIPNRRLIS